MKYLACSVRTGQWRISTRMSDMKSGASPQMDREDVVNTPPPAFDLAVRGRASYSWRHWVGGRGSRLVGGLGIALLGI